MALRPEDRYASPRALADDVEHWLADEPVSAYREPWPERLAPLGAAAPRLDAAGGGLCLAIVAALSTTLAVQSSRNCGGCWGRRWTS